MRKAAARLPSLFSIHALLRTVVAIYFMALALGLVPGTEPGNLLAILLPTNAANPVMQAIVFALAGCVLIGIQRRTAALSLAMLMFAASYVSMLSQPANQDIGTFWRDLALIGALLATFRDSAQTAVPVRRKTSEPAPVEPPYPLQGNDLLGSPQMKTQATPIKPRVTSKLYREDLKIVRAS